MVNKQPAVFWFSTDMLLLVLLKDLFKLKFKVNYAPVIKINPDVQNGLRANFSK